MRGIYRWVFIGRYFVGGYFDCGRLDTANLQLLPFKELASYLKSALVTMTEERNTALYDTWYFVLNIRIKFWGNNRLRYFYKPF